MFSDSAHMAYPFLPEPPPPLHPPQSFGCMDLDLGRFDEALGLLTPALEMFQRLSTGRGEPDEAKCMYCVASCLYNQVRVNCHVTPAHRRFHVSRVLIVGYKPHVHAFKGTLCHERGQKCVRGTPGRGGG